VGDCVIKSMHSRHGDAWTWVRCSVVYILPFTHITHSHCVRARACVRYNNVHAWQPQSPYAPGAVREARMKHPRMSCSTPVRCIPRHKFKFRACKHVLLALQYLVPTWIGLLRQAIKYRTASLRPHARASHRVLTTCVHQVKTLAFLRFAQACSSIPSVSSRRSP
jgi:hypothetical protein